MDEKLMKPPNPSFSVGVSYYSQGEEIWYEGHADADETDDFIGWHAVVLGLLAEEPHAIDDSIELPEDLVQAIRVRVLLAAPEAWNRLLAAIAINGDKGQRIQFETIANRVKALRFHALMVFFWLKTGNSVAPYTFAGLASHAQSLRQFITTVLEEYVLGVE